MSRTVEVVVGIASVATFGAMVLAVPWLVTRLPADYFVRPPRAHALPVRIARNVVGALLVVLGFAMLVLPGQGLLTILLGLAIADLSFKHRLLLWILHRSNFQRAIQAIRTRAGKPLLLLPTPPT